MSEVYDRVDWLGGYSLALRPDRLDSSLKFFEKGFDLSTDDRLKVFELRFSPWIRTLCVWFDNPEINWIYLLSGSQISKTLFMMGLLLYVSR